MGNFQRLLRSAIGPLPHAAGFFALRFFAQGRAEMFRESVVELWKRVCPDPVPDEPGMCL
jgi:hypothetical protein